MRGGGNGLVLAMLANRGTVHSCISPGPPPGPVHRPVQKKKNFSPLRCTGRWKLATNGGSWQHFYKRLNALRSARIESREDSKRHSVAEIEKNGCFFAFYECCTIVLLMVVYNRKYIYTSMNFLCEMLFLAAT